MAWIVLFGLPEVDDPEMPYTWTKCVKSFPTKQQAAHYGLGWVTGSKEHLLIVEDWRADAVMELLNATETDLLATQLLSTPSVAKKKPEKEPEPVKQTNPDYWK